MLIKNCMLIDGADIFEEMKDIRIVNGKIKEVADCLMPEGDEEIIDAEGALVTPGIVEPSCQVGVNSQIHRFEENDANEEGPIVPELRAYDALNFEDEGFSMALRAGVTTVVTGPGNGNLIGGTCAALKTAGASREKRIIKPEAAYRFVLTSGPRKRYGGKNRAPQTRLASAAMIRDILFKAKEYARKEKAGESQEFKLELAALSRVFDGMPVQMAAMKANDMETAVRIGEEFGLNYVLTMAYDASQVIRDLDRKRPPFYHRSPLWDQLFRGGKWKIPVSGSRAGEGRRPCGHFHRPSGDESGDLKHPADLNDRPGFKPEGSAQGCDGLSGRVYGNFLPSRHSGAWKGRRPGDLGRRSTGV